MTTPIEKLLDLTGNVALVTGASAGIGAGIAKRLAEAGASTAIHYRGGRDDAEALAASIRGAGGTAMTVHAELTDLASVEAAFGAIADDLGPVDIVVNNAARQTHSTLRDMSSEEWRNMMAVNLDGVFNVTKVATEALIARGAGGSIVNIASIEAFHTAPTHPHYATTKAGLLMFTQASALEFGPHRIRVNAVSPGVIHRDGIEENWPEGVKRWMNAVPLGRLGQDEDIANAVLFLVSPASSFITGANLVVDGGITATPAF